MLNRPCFQNDSQLSLGRLHCTLTNDKATGANGRQREHVAELTRGAAAPRLACRVRGHDVEGPRTAARARSRRYIRRCSADKPALNSRERSYEAVRIRRDDEIVRRNERQR